jgi:hypothetical protein
MCPSTNGGNDSRIGLQASKTVGWRYCANFEERTAAKVNTTGGRMVAKLKFSLTRSQNVEASWRPPAEQLGCWEREKQGAVHGSHALHGSHTLQIYLKPRRARIERRGGLVG